MAITVAWATGVISVPQADLALISGSLYELDLDVFRLALKALEASEEGMAWPDTHLHNTEVVLGGVTYARTVEIINGYTVTFEDGQYAVRLSGANSNVEDVTNVNQVSIRSQNSAGLISATALANKISEVWQHAGLDASNPVTVTDTDVTTGSISLTIAAGASSRTLTRTP